MKGFQTYENEKSTPSKGRNFLKFGPKFENLWKKVSIRLKKRQKLGKIFEIQSL